MAWNRRYSLISYLKSSLWLVPVLAALAALVLQAAGAWLESWLEGAGWRPGFYGLDEAEAHALLERIFSLNGTCLVFAFGSLLVAIQVASGQYTPRIIATTLLRDRVIRWSTGVFVFTMLWAHRTMLQLGQVHRVPQGQVWMATIFGACSLVAFIVLIDYAARMLRPVSLVGQVGKQGLAVIESVYPLAAGELPEDRQPAAPRRPRGVPDRVVPYRGKSAVVLALNLRGLVDEAARAGCVIEFAAQVGDFVGIGEPLFYVYGAGANVDEARIASLVAMGSERTMEQDPMFAFRIVVDIALKALSAAINDPTTAVLAIDQLQRLLGKVGRQALHDHEIKDGAGQPRLILRTPGWEDFVHITFREIRYYGAGSLQVERRLRAMADTLFATLPAHRHSALRAELELLDAEARRQHLLRADALLARVPDSQGLGGAAGALGPGQSRDRPL